MSQWNRALGVLALLAALAGALLVLPASGVAQTSSGVTVIARGLTSPGGFTWNENDVIFVALAGSGGTDTLQPEAPAPFGPLLVGSTGAVAGIDGGCPEAIATNIGSTRTPSGAIYGAEAIAELGGQLYLLYSNAGDRFGAHEQTDGIYRVTGSGSLQLVADHAAFLQENPPAVAPPEGLPNPGNAVAMVAGSDRLWIVDQLNGLVSSVVPGSDETLVADLSDRAFAPSDLALGPNGSLYVSSLTRAPYPAGTASVVQISSDGQISDVWTGLTMASGVAIDANGDLYVTELASGQVDDAPFAAPASGRLLRQTGPESSEVVADGLSFPSALATGPDGALYFVSPAIGSDTGNGWIGRYAPDGSAGEVAPSACEPIAETLTEGAPTPVAPQVTPTEAPVVDVVEETPVPTAEPTALPPFEPDGAAPTGEIIEVGLQEYSIDMPTELPAGPVTFVVTNYGTIPHSLQIEGPGVDQVLIHELEPGQEGAFTVDLQPGTYAVICPIAGHRDNGMSVVLTIS